MKQDLGSPVSREARAAGSGRAAARRGRQPARPARRRGAARDARRGAGGRRHLLALRGVDSAPTAGAAARCIAGRGAVRSARSRSRGQADAGTKAPSRRSGGQRRRAVARVLPRPPRPARLGGDAAVPGLPRHRGGGLPRPGHRTGERAPVDGFGLRRADGGAYRYYGVGVEHIAFDVDTRDEVDGGARRAAGPARRSTSRREEDRDEPGYYAFFAFDPDGIRIEVFCWT